MAGRQLRLLVLIEEQTRGCLTIKVGRSFTAQDVMGVLQYLLAVGGTPEHLSLEKCTEIISKVICRWLKDAELKTLFLARVVLGRKTISNRSIARIAMSYRNREIFLSFHEICCVIDCWRFDYIHHRIDSSLYYQTQSAYAAGCVLPASAAAQLPEHSSATNPNSLSPPDAQTGGWSHRMQLIVNDIHEGLKADRQETFASVDWQLSSVHLTQNTIHHGRKVEMHNQVTDVIRNMLNATDARHSEEEFGHFVHRYQHTAPRPAARARTSIAEDWGIPGEPPNRMRTTNKLERQKRKLKCRTRVASLLPNKAFFIRVATADFVELSNEREIRKAIPLNYKNLHENELKKFQKNDCTMPVLNS